MCAHVCVCLAPRAVAQAQAHSLGPLLVTGHAVLQGRLGGPQSLLEDVRVRGLYPLVVVLFRLHNLEAKLGVELDGTLVVHLDVQKYAVEISIFLDIV
uniref:Putative secreted protein n=1 Tax=Ixodes ricinus TaxID=34613 RepID=A0A6B0U4V6_IXORI